MKDVVVITGASAGVGRATAHEFARRGAKIAIIARDADSLTATKQELEEAGATEILALPADVADAGAVETAADLVEQKLGPIDIWINDAMVTVFAPVSDITPEEFKRVTEVTYLGTVHGTMAALKRMKPRNKGTIVQVGSALSYRAIPLQSAYCGAKFAIRGFTDALRCELIHEKSRVHVTMVQLPAVNTPQFDWALNKMPKKVEPLPPIFQPEVIARAIFYAATHRRREMFLGWPAVKAIIGNKLAPAYADRVLARIAYGGQETNSAADHSRANNLYDPMPEEARTEGRFSPRAKSFSPMIWADINRLPLAILTGVLAASVISYIGWCPESPRFDAKPWKREWWKRQRYHAKF
jgi:short-subunit dehydrogenase